MLSALCEVAFLRSQFEAEAIRFSIREGLKDADCSKKGHG